MSDRNGPSLGAYKNVPMEDALAPDPIRDLGARNDADDDDTTDDQEAGFLPMEYDAESSIPPPDTALKNRVLAMSVLFLFIAELSAYIMEPPLQEIMEDFVCHENYPDHRPWSWDEPDPRCKEPVVEGMLAMARSWMMWAEMVVPLFVQIPYGMMADKYGRRPVLFLALFGSLLTTVWQFVVLLGPGKFSVWQLPAGAIGTLIGGGDSVSIAMVWTILTDVVPADERTSLFYKLHAMMLIMSAALRPVAGWLMSKDPWLPMWIGLITLVLTVLSTLLVPETLHLSQNPKSSYHHKTAGQVSQRATTAVALLAKGIRLARVEVARIWHFVFSSQKVMLLITAYGLSSPVFMAMDMNMLQYMTVRFGWDWSTATYYSIVSKVASVVVLLGILPLISRVVEERWYKTDPISRDLLLARWSIVFTIASSVLTVIAAVPWVLMLSFVVHGAGAGFRSQIRALVAETVDRTSLATTSSVMAMVQTLTGLIATPLFGWLLSKGIEIGGFWMGLPFIMTTVCTVGAGIALVVF